VSDTATNQAGVAKTEEGQSMNIEDAQLSRRSLLRGAAPMIACAVSVTGLAQFAMGQQAVLKSPR